MCLHSEHNPITCIICVYCCNPNHYYSIMQLYIHWF